MTADARAVAEARLCAAVLVELGQGALDGAWQAFGAAAVEQWADGALWLHLREQRWASTDGDAVMVVDESVGGMARAVLVRDGVIVAATARPLGAHPDDN
jgi:hypothetical protein